MVNRRMFRPSFGEAKEQPLPRAQNHGPVPSKKPAPAEITHAENFYWVKQMQSRTPMIVTLESGEELRGIIEWYDRTCLKVNRDSGEPNLMIYKPAIKYMFKEEENVR